MKFLSSSILKFSISNLLPLFQDRIQNLFFFRYLVERAVERLRRQGEAQFAGVSADLEARLVGFGGI